MQNNTTLDWFCQHGAKFCKVAARDKKPLGKGWQNKPLTLDEVLPHVQKGGNVGMLCGAVSGNLGLLDIDANYNAFCKLAPGLALAPAITRPNADRAKIIIRIEGEIPEGHKWLDVPNKAEWLSTGNQGVIPPSIHPSGETYNLINSDQPISVMTADSLRDLVTTWTGAPWNGAQKNAPAPALPDGRGKLSRATLEFIANGAGEGERNHRLFTAACDLCGAGYSQPEAEAKLLPVTDRIGTPEAEAKATIDSAYKQPRKPARPDAFTAAPARPVTVYDPPEPEAPPDEFLTLPPEIEELTSDGPEDDENGETFPIMANVPDLPKGARLSDREITEGEKAGAWVNDYVQFAVKASPMTPALFHESFALGMLSTAIARRVFVRAGKNTIFPNLYMLLVAQSTLYAKTTGLDVVEDVLKMAGLNYLTLPTGVTPQSLITELSNRTPPTFDQWGQDDRADWQKERQFSAQRAWWMDEAASLLDLFRQKHTADLLSLILKLFNCPEKLTASTIGRGRETVRYSYLTICGPTTPAAMRSHLKNAELWGDGLFARFLFVTPNTPPVFSFYDQSQVETPPDLAKHLNALAFTRLPMPKETGLGSVEIPPTVQAAIPGEVYERWKSYAFGLWQLLNSKTIPEKLYSPYGRLATTSLKIATLLAASDWAVMAEGNPLVIRPAHWARAQMMTEEYRASLHRLIEDASNPLADEDQDIAEKVLAKANTHRNSRREIGQDLHMWAGIQRDRLERIFEQLIKDGLLFERQAKGKRGPATMRLFTTKNP